MESYSVKQRSRGGTDGMASQSTSETQKASARMKKTGPSSHWTLMVLFFSLLLDLLGFTVILPLIPSLLEYYGRGDQVQIASRVCEFC